ncbi:Rrf2 family transcriptional regulator [Flavobacterium rhizosphaerae]|uniref:Rrf2 family transcriptional regulator n=1 Tax=Flavobacterium rhizosphaerae TaxID=3163298 RepID=A0ABW8YWY2_9FLAO
MISGKFAINLHILSLMTRHPDEYLSSEFLAGSMNINPVLVRKEIGNLKRNNIVECREGKFGGSRLAINASAITLQDIFNITFESLSFGYCKNEPNPQCPIGNKINDNLDLLYNEINCEINKKLNAITLSDFTSGF